MTDSYGISDEEEIYRFIEKHLPRGREIAAKYGFAVARTAGEPVSPAERQRKIRVRLVQAIGALTDLGQWLDDDVEEVRSTARDAIHKCLQVAYTGDRPEPPRGILERFFHRTDRMVNGYLQRFVDPDQAEPRWAQARNLRRIRLAGITAALLAATAAALCFWMHLFPAAIASVGAMAVIDGLEGSFARVMCMHDAQVRWHSLVASHAGDVVVMLGMSAYLLTARLFPFA